MSIDKQMLVALCQIDTYSFGVEAARVTAVPSVPRGQRMIDVAHRLGLHPAVQRRALRLWPQDDTYLVVGTPVRVETIQPAALHPLPRFLRGLPHLLGWVQQADTVSYLLDIDSLLEDPA